MLAPKAVPQPGSGFTFSDHLQFVHVHNDIQSYKSKLWSSPRLSTWTPAPLFVHATLGMHSINFHYYADDTFNMQENESTQLLLLV